MKNVSTQRTPALGLAGSFSVPAAWRPAMSMPSTYAAAKFGATDVAAAALAPAALAVLQTVKTPAPISTIATKQHQVTTAAARTTRNGTTRNGTTEGSSLWRSPV
jgi:hypothetical protein